MREGKRWSGEWDGGDGAVGGGQDWRHTETHGYAMVTTHAQATRAYAIARACVRAHTRESREREKGASGECMHIDACRVAQEEGSTGFRIICIILNIYVYASF